MSHRRPLASLCAGLAVLATAATAATGSDVAATAVCPAPPPMTFTEPEYVDTTRAGGEPIVFTYPNGRILYGSHAGTTHFYSPDAADPTTIAFMEQYRGQTHYWWSDTQGGEWDFAERTGADTAAPYGFSDPEFAYDTAGNVYVSEINLVNVAVSKSTDGGKTYTMTNPTANVFTDRQWMEGDEEGVVYMVSNPTGPGGSVNPGEADTYQVNSGHTMYKSTDGGVTWTDGFPDPGGLGDIRVDKRNGTVYEAHLEGSELTLHAWRNARGDDFTSKVDAEVNIVFDDVHMLAHWPAFDLDPEGNIYMVWDDNGVGELPAGIYYSYSTTEGRTWSKPLRVNNSDNTAIWPWIGVGDEGRVGIAWLEADVELPQHDAETPGEHGWRIVGATSITALGCAGGKLPSFAVGTMTEDPMHTGTICQGGTVCQATLTDRRLGDYFSVDVDGKGMMYAGYSDTREGGAISLPGFVRQNGGASLLAPKTPVTPPKKPTNTGGNTGGPDTGGNTGGIPTTGLDVALPVAAAGFALAAVALRRRRRPDES